MSFGYTLQKKHFYLLSVQTHIFHLAHFLRTVSLSLCSQFTNFMVSEVKRFLEEDKRSGRASRGAAAVVKRSLRNILPHKEESINLEPPLA
jgi:hypothetical protein